jgi:hypothetical protein
MIYEVKIVAFYLQGWIVHQKQRLRTKTTTSRAITIGFIMQRSIVTG